MTHHRSEDLEVIIERVKEVMMRYRAGRRAAIEAALDGGILLLQARQKLQYGDWQPYLEKIGMAERTARSWLRLTESGLRSTAILFFGGIRQSLEHIGRASEVLRGEQGFESEMEKSMLVAIGLAMHHTSENSPHPPVDMRLWLSESAEVVKEKHPELAALMSAAGSATVPPETGHGGRFQGQDHTDDNPPPPPGLPSQQGGGQEPPPPPPEDPAPPAPPPPDTGEQEQPPPPAPGYEDDNRPKVIQVPYETYREMEDRTSRLVAQLDEANEKIRLYEESATNSPDPETSAVVAQQRVHINSLESSIRLITDERNSLLDQVQRQQAVIKSFKGDLGAEPEYQDEQDEQAYQDAMQESAPPDHEFNGQPGDDVPF